MRRFFHVVPAIFIVITLTLAPPALAKTPDGDTPAEESVCDVLTADGVTKGLYGLCVAFCEAQDYDYLDPASRTAPSGAILRNYDKKRKDTDPPMPCTLPQETCPCWTDEELADIDGYSTTGQALFLECAAADASDPDSVSYFYENRTTLVDGDPTTAGNFVEAHTGDDAACRYKHRSREKNRWLTVTEGSLTPSEAQACHAQLLNAVNTYGLQCWQTQR